MEYAIIGTIAAESAIIGDTIVAVSLLDVFWQS
jgi:hypothetical protein